MKYPTEGHVLIHLLEVAQTAHDAGDAELAGQLIAEAYTGFEILQHRAATSETRWSWTPQVHLNTQTHVNTQASV